MVVLFCRGLVGVEATNDHFNSAPIERAMSGIMGNFVILIDLIIFCCIIR
jgi:hypothetical protein